MRRISVLGFTVVLLGLLAWAGVHQMRVRRAAIQKAQENRVTLTPVSPEEKQGPSLDGKPAPAFTLVDLKGKKVSLDDFKGKPVILSYWATYCVPCKEEMPWLEEFRKQYAAQGLEVVGIDSSSDAKPKAEVSKTAQGFGVTFPILLADDKIEDTYGVDVLPTAFFVDAKGVVREKTVGVPPVGGKEELEGHIKKLIAGGM